MHLTLTHEDPMNTSMLDADTGKPLYEVETEKKVLKKLTIMRRVTEDNAEASSSFNGSSSSADNGIVAEVEWHRSRPSRVSFQRKRHMPLNMFLHNGSGSGVFKLSRVFVTPDGTQYIWRSKSDHLELFEKTTKNLVAKSHPQGLDVQESGHAFIDQLVLTYIVMEKKRREKMTLTGGTAGKVQSEDSQTQSDES